MMNAEKFKDEILAKVDKTERFAIETNNQNVLRNCIDLECSECLFNEGTGLCYFERMKWLLSKYKKPVKLTRFEHDVLKHLLEKTQYRFIVREKSDNIYIYKRKPKKGTGAWDISSGMQNLNIFVNLFPFIKWEDSEPTSIEYVLNNCEVVDGESE